MTDTSINTNTDTNPPAVTPLGDDNEQSSPRAQHLVVSLPYSTCAYVGAHYLGSVLTAKRQ